MNALNLCEPYTMPAVLQHPIKDWVIGAATVISLTVATPLAWTEEPKSLCNNDSQTETVDHTLVIPDKFNDKQPYFRRLNGFLALEENWNGYGAAPVEQKAWANARAIINLMSARSLANWNLYPSASGTVLFTVKGRRLSTFDIGNDQFSYFAAEMKKPNFMEGREENPDAAKVVELITKVEEYFGLA